jgi:hypothetical protein
MSNIISGTTVEQVKKMKELCSIAKKFIISDGTDKIHCSNEVIILWDDEHALAHIIVATRDFPLQSIAPLEIMSIPYHAINVIKPCLSLEEEE